MYLGFFLCLKNLFSVYKYAHMMYNTDRSNEEVMQVSVKLWLCLGAVLLAALLCVLLFASCASRRSVDDVSLSFHSFDGGGPKYTVTIDDPSILICTSERKYAKANHEELDGAGYMVTFTFKGLKSGQTGFTVSERSPIGDNSDTRYTAVVDDALHVTLRQQDTSSSDRDPLDPVPTLILCVNDAVFYPHLEDTPAAEAFVEYLSQEQSEIEMHDNGGFEKVGALPLSLPQNDAAVTTQPGDILLYQGDQLCVCYDETTADYTRIARIDDVTRAELLDVLGEGDTTVSLWVEWSE